MRRYDIVSGILLILSIIDFALAAPVSTQEKPQERVDVVHVPKDVITVLGKRWEEDLEKLGEEYLKTGGKSVESSGSTLSSSSAPSGPDHGSTNVVQPPAPNPASSTANPDPLMEPSRCSSSKWARGSCFGIPWKDLLLSDDEDELYRGSFNTLVTPYEHSEDQELTWAEAARKPKPEPIPIQNPTPSIHPLADPNFDWEKWMNAEDPPPGLPSPKGFSQAHKYPVDPNLPSTSGSVPSPPEPEPEPEVVTPSPPSSNLGPPNEPEDEAARQAAIYAAKGKAKVSRRISGTATDVGNAAQRELQPAGSYLV
jgi:hypothetical protein